MGRASARLCSPGKAPQSYIFSCRAVAAALLWPGNVRELRRTINRLTAPGPAYMPVRLADVPPDIATAAPRRPLTRFERAEISAILNALADCHGNKTDAARLVGISRSTLYRKLRAGGIDLENTAFQSLSVPGQGDAEAPVGDEPRLARYTSSVLISWSRREHAPGHGGQDLREAGLDPAPRRSGPRGSDGGIRRRR
jgi:hypothetical protein